MLPELSSDWPVLRAYNEADSIRIAMPIGGIGTGTISLGGRGNLRDFENMNRPAKGFNPRGEEAGPAFFALRVAPEGAVPVARLLEGPIPEELYEGGFGTPCGWHGLPRFRHRRFLA